MLRTLHSSVAFPQTRPMRPYRETLSDMLMPLAFLAAVTLFFGLWWGVTDQSEQNWIATMQALRPDIR